MDFIVYSLPRSRSYWLSRFLNYGQFHCGHDEIRYARTLDDIGSYLSMPFTGTVETAAAPFWRLVPSHIRTVTLRRPVDEIIDSMTRAGLGFDTTATAFMLERANHKLDQIEKRIPNVLSVKFHELNDEATCRAIFEHCLPYQHDTVWYNNMASLNLQIDLKHVINYYTAHTKQIVKMTKIAKQAMIQSIQPPAPDLDAVGISIKEEPFQRWLDEKIMVGNHFAVIGEAPDMIEDMNIDAMKRLDENGQLQMLVARSNGRAFGYLISVINESMMEAGKLTGYHTAFYASSEFRGLGTKLVREANALLEQKGVTEFIGRTGNRDSADRLASLYKRMGASEHGHLFLMRTEPAFS